MSGVHGDSSKLSVVLMEVLAKSVEQSRIVAVPCVLKVLLLPPQ